MTFDNPLRKCQTETGAALFLRREKWFKDIAGVLFRNSMAVVGDNKMHPVMTTPQAQAKSTV